MSSGAPTSPSKGGGILRSRKQKSNNGSNGGPKEEHASGRVTFSNNGDEDEGGVARKSTMASSSRTPTINHRGAANDGGGYDSDEVDDAIMASGDGFAMGGRKQKDGGGGGDDDVDMDDAVLRTPAEIEEAKRRRGRVRRREDQHEGGEEGDFDKDDDIMDNDRDDAKDGAPPGGLSLITNESADPDAYESNAAGNASCPVEPFNMNAEKEGGMGYFDGDTYVFRQNTKPVDGEEDAWLDGLGDDGEKETGGGGLDSTSVWKGSIKDAKEKRKAKFVSEDAIPEDLGRRLATLLQNDNETVMSALTRNGASMRELQAREQKMLKKSKVKKRKSKSKKEEAVSSNNAAATPDTEEEMKQWKIKLEQTRDTVEELTELADALLFGGEVEAYDLTKSDWIHRFKLEQYFPSSVQRKRPPGAADVGDDVQAKKKSRGYFAGTTDADTKEGDSEQADTQEPPQHTPEVVWEYKGNEDGSIHGPYTSKQMLDWTSCGYFVGESAVDIRRVGSGGEPGKDDTKPKSEEEAKADVDDLMADLMDDDDEGETKRETEDTSWMRSDRVDFSLYL